MHTIRRLETADSDAVGAMQARAFFDDPLQAWALPDATTRLGLLETMFTLLTRVMSVPMGESFADATLSTAAFWVPPGRWGEPLNDETRAALSVLDGQLERSTTRRFAAANEVMHAAHPSEPHWYLQGLGTEPDRQGQGLATAVLAPILARADLEQTPCYLESTKLRNVAFYERQGFTVTQTIAVPDGGPTLWAMWRSPRTVVT